VDELFVFIQDVVRHLNWYANDIVHMECIDIINIT